MPNSVNRISLVTPGHLASNPRIVKEADALHEAGFAVKVIAADTNPGVRLLDDTISARATWPVAKVGYNTRAHYLATRLRQKFARTAFNRGVTGISTAIWAQSPLIGSLSKAAAAEPADLYIGHNLAALPAVVAAARLHGAKIGFDAEDDHVGELDDTPENKLEISIRKQIEAQFLPQCEHLTASSPGIAQAYHERYGVTMIPILNVFPLAQQAPRPAPVDRKNDMLSVYWFSQTIGPGRGLEPFIQAMGIMRGHATLTIRGSDFLGYSSRLRALAKEAGVIEAVRFLPSAAPDEMARLAARHDVGLASETDSSPNRKITLSNKIFTYLLAGIPVLLSDTPAQRALAAQLGEAAHLCNLMDPSSIVAALSSWIDGSALASAKREAWRLAKTRFNWDLEKDLFVQNVRQTLQ
jgi:glycosyltransferase involved in cell wall biosynthesis